MLTANDWLSSAESTKGPYWLWSQQALTVASNMTTPKENAWHKQTDPEVAHSPLHRSPYSKVTVLHILRSLTLECCAKYAHRKTTI
eukprot:4243220-Amphidinium_carterae.2